MAVALTSKLPRKGRNPGSQSGLLHTSIVMVMRATTSFKHSGKKKCRQSKTRKCFDLQADYRSARDIANATVAKTI